MLMLQRQLTTSYRKTNFYPKMKCLFSILGQSPLAYISIRVKVNVKVKIALNIDTDKNPPFRVFFYCMNSKLNSWCAGCVWSTTKLISFGGRSALTFMVAAEVKKMQPGVKF
jgi:hypothetical protein